MKHIFGIICVNSCLVLAACSDNDSNQGQVAPNDALKTARSHNIASIVAAMSDTRTPAIASQGLTQSSMNGSTAEATFNGTTTTLVVTSPDGSTATFGGTPINSDQKIVEYSDVDQPPAFWSQGHSMTSAELTDTTIRFASVETSYAESDPTSYLTFGFWEEYGRDETQQSPTFGTFVNGPEIATDNNFSWDTFVADTATYEGIASGIYAYHIPDQPESEEFGLFQTDLTLELNLNNRTILGHAGRENGVQVMSGAETRTLPISVQINETEINSNGAFSSDDFTIVSTLVNVTNSTGSVSGRLSSTSNTNGQPRLAAGTVGATWTDEASGKGSLNGAWVAAGQ